MKTEDKSWTKDSHKILEEATNLDNYNAWIISQFSKYFGQDILEIGSGLGGLSALLPKNRNITLSDNREDYVLFLKRELERKVLKIDIEKDNLEINSSKFDTILSSNVFEHIKNDDLAIKNCFSLLKKNGHLLLFVPSRPEIYGKLDHAMGHYRRYTLDGLKDKVKAAGFSIIECRYANIIGYFTWWGRGLFKVNKADGLLASIFDTFLVPLLYLEKYFKLPFGQNLLLVAKKD